MIDFELSEEQQLIQATARDFAREVLLPQARNRDRDQTFPVAELKRLASIGLLGVNVPQSLGGSEAGAVAYALAMMELASGCASTTVAVAVTNMVSEIIVKYGSEAQQHEHVPRLQSGEYVCGAFALSEPHTGSDAAALKTSARRVDDGWIVNGSKQWITSGDHSGILIVWAKTSPAGGARGLSAFLVRAGTPGLVVGKHEDKMGLRGSTTVPLTFEDMKLPADALLGREGDGFKIAMEALDGGRIGVASQAFGIGRAALQAATAYAKERKAFGNLLAEFQAIQWMLADSATELEAARLLVLRAAWLKEHGQPFTREASMGKVFSSEAAWRACDRALQVHGGNGYVREYDVERYLRDVRVTRIYEGTSEVQRIVIARTLLREFGIQ
jgi:alkylation response protein AidB-like acyl-CoA dehydrogenase